MPDGQTIKTQPSRDAEAATRTASSVPVQSEKTASDNPLRDVPVRGATRPDTAIAGTSAGRSTAKSGDKGKRPDARPINKADGIARQAEAGQAEAGQTDAAQTNASPTDAGPTNADPTGTSPADVSLTDVKPGDTVDAAARTPIGSPRPGNTDRIGTAASVDARRNAGDAAGHAGTAGASQSDSRQPDATVADTRSGEGLECSVNATADEKQPVDTGRINMATSGTAGPKAATQSGAEGKAARPAEISTLSDSERIDRDVRSDIAAVTKGFDPTGLMAVSLNWMQRLAVSPGKQADLWQLALRNAGLLSASAWGVDAGFAKDRRFASEGWTAAPFSFLRDAFLATEDWWLQATTGISGVSPRNQAALQFALRQTLDAMAPANFPHLNPDVVTRARETGGDSLVKGWANLMEDLAKRPHDEAAMDPRFRIGEGLAATPGKVVARTRLAELIQYTPTTADAHPEPILIVPAWIMKYYILDLSAQNSMVAWLVSQGFTVFMISWLNPGSDERDLGMADYLEQGPMAALAAIQAITGATKIHTAGYCLGGTLLSIAAAEMARDGDDRLASMTLLAAQTDFSEAGDLSLFVSEGQVSQLEDLMWKDGYLDGAQMAQAFTLMHSNDLVWSKMIHDYMLGERYQPNDMMIWNADTTRMPYRMHSEYLRGMFLNNLLADGRYDVDGRKVSLTDLRLPIFAVGTETDHVAPWRSVFKIQRLAEAETTFVLTSGGHNAGIVSEPGHRHRHYRIATAARDDRFCDPETWFAANAPVDGSWWLAWGEWLAARSTARTAPPPTGRARAGFPPICDAPGTYIFKR